ncbi:MAG: hypothetical protein M3Q33_07015 [Acidobacteriota bacterium]|nr:hypothetical protein [Acidobacteriota bacterium]
MLSSNSAKVFFISLLAFTVFSSCRWWQKAENETPTPTPFVAEEIKSGIPFSTKEPENFQAEFVFTAPGEREDKTFAARGDNVRRYDYNYGQKTQVSMVQTADSKSFLLFRDKKVYAENSNNEIVQSAENPFDFLTTEWLNQKADAKFESLGAENEVLKYRVILGANQKSESIIWVDENIGLPVKQEFYSTDGEQRTLNFTFEMKNFKLQADADLFEVPKDFRKVSVEDFRRILQSKN